jgi:signal transduction histidine kinase
MFKSIRHGLFAALAGFTALICLAYTGLALVISYVTEDMLVDRLLQREAAAITAHFQLHGNIRAPQDDLIRIYRDAGALPPRVRAQVAAGRERAEIAAGSGQHYHLRTLELPAASGQRVYLLADVRPLLVVSQLFQEAGGILTAMATALIVLALLLAYLLSRRLVSPLLVLADEVRSVSPDSPATFTARERGDEIGYLAHKLGDTISELHAALEREHTFTRDISHELRTPLTVMHNTLQQPLAAQDVTQLKTSLTDIGNTIDVLFALARAEHIAQAVFDLRICIEESLLHLLDENYDEERLILDLPEQLNVVGNRHLATLLVNNCVSNALFHGSSGTRLQLSFADGVLSLTNSTDAERAGTTQGFRHGQQLLRRIAEAMQWDIRFHAGAAVYRVDITPR